LRTVDERLIAAGLDACFRIAADVEQWPTFLPHYRWVRFHQRSGFGTGRVEMAAWRLFPGGLRYPVWWISDMHLDENRPAVHYRHVRGVTRGMDVVWSFTPRADATLVRIIHDWDGPPWPGIGGLAARHIIGPHFISAIASRTLMGVARAAEAPHLSSRDPELR
jgi:coenzyme Q-binding protein COQ10